jgi:GTPase SAR1 family protein
MGVKNLLKNFAKFLASIAGEEALVALKEEIKSKYREYFKNKNVLILGDKQSGKTSLIYLLKEGKPYEVDEDGNVKAPSPTAMTSVIDETAQLEKGAFGRIKEDVPGDKDLRDTWIEAIDESDPHGIIYMVDGSKKEEKIESTISNLKSTLDEAYGNLVSNLKAIHVFVNFSDVWSKNKVEDRKLKRKVEKMLDDALIKVSNLKEIEVGVHDTQLSPHKESWKKADVAISKFGADIKSR